MLVLFDFPFALILAHWWTLLAIFGYVVLVTVLSSVALDGSWGFRSTHKYVSKGVCSCLSLGSTVAFGRPDLLAWTFAATFLIVYWIDPACGFEQFGLPVDFWQKVSLCSRTILNCRRVGSVIPGNMNVMPTLSWFRLEALMGVNFGGFDIWNTVTIRYGEADHPGPDVPCSNFAITCCNPSGVAGKEAALLDLPHGIVNVAETHLSSVGHRSSLGYIRKLAASTSRRLRLIPGAPVALRPQSTVTGTWSGVLQMADFGGHRLDLPWPNQEYSLGRVLTSKFFVGTAALVGTVLYGWTSSPSWPQGRQATLDLLTHLTEQVILGSSGPRYITGDFNGDETHFAILNHWKNLGWVEAQDLHAALFQELPRPTFQHKTRPDRLYLSPELAQHFVRSSLRDDFAGHSTLIGYFDMPCEAVPRQWWRQASKIPWSAVDLNAWHAHPACHPPDPADCVDSTQFFRKFGQAYESSFRGHCDEGSVSGLPSACLGRASVMAPSFRLESPPSLRPSRHGEEAPASGFVCRQVGYWFKQLRRLQALVQNFQAGKCTPTALEYRLLTWRAIRNARGFQDGFSAWWLVRPKCLQGVVAMIPETLPSLQVLHGIYEDFRINYRAFESWNLRQRAHVAKVSLQESLGKAFYSVIGKPSKPIDHFEQKLSASVVSVDPSDHSVWTDGDLPCNHNGVWSVDGVPATVSRSGPCHFMVQTDLLLCSGQQLELSVFLTDTDDMLRAVEDFWTQRWQKHVEITPEHWARILGFVTAHLAPLPFVHPGLSLDLWDDTVLRFHSRSARGPDAFDHLDLRRMPLDFKSSLLSMLERIEGGDEWPVQLLEGSGICLPKSLQASTVGEHRPVIVFSVVYRAWASLRSRLCLSVLGKYAGPRMKGFLSRCEAGDLWFLVQALAEGSLADGSPLTGVFSDLVKAFESVPRKPLATLALALGMDPAFVDSWMRFLNGCTRRFTLHGYVGHALTSSVGMPEGCALSVLGMSLLDFCWDRYQQVYCPSVGSFSYVDNLCLMADSVVHLMAAQASMHTFFELWGMALDPRKTYAWATLPADRAALKRLGNSVRLTSSELGGSLSFCRRSAASLQVVRINSLDDAWRALKRSSTSGYTKELILRRAFWPKALHGICITPLPWRFIKSLRTKAVRALGHGKAGSHPGVRLSLLCQTPDTDPAVFQLLRTFLEFRRLIAKQPALVQVWRDFQLAASSGLSVSGPFTKLQEQSALLSWTLADPPWFLDHDGCRHNLLTMPALLLKDLLLDAWYQSLATEVGHRKDFAGLVGLQWPPVLSDRSLSLVEVARVNALRDGSFLTGQVQGKFDLLKGSRCHFCGMLDTLEHRCCQCPRYNEVRARHPEAMREWSQCPVALRERLLPGRNPFVADLKHLFLNMDSFETDFQLGSLETQTYDLFTDGSAFHPVRPGFGLATFAVVSVQHELPIAAGPLRGLQQDSNRAELTAIGVAITWCIRFEVQGTIWTDSAYAGSGLYKLLCGGSPEDFDSHEDLWRSIAGLLAQCTMGQIQVQHVAGHQTHVASGDLTAWMAWWNEVADRVAHAAHSMRPASFYQVWNQYVEWGLQQKRQLQCFRALHLDMALLPPLVTVGDDIDDEADPIPQMRSSILDVDSLVDGLPMNWKCRWQ